MDERPGSAAVCGILDNDPPKTGVTTSKKRQTRLPEMIPPVTTTTTDEESRCLEELETMRTGLTTPPPDARGGPAAMVLATTQLTGWCLRAGATLFTQQGLITAIGRKAVHSLALLLSERPDLWSPEVSDWLSSRVLPCLLTNDGAVEAAHADLFYLLLRALLRRGEIAPNPEATPRGDRRRRGNSGTTAPPRKAAKQSAARSSKKPESVVKEEEG